MSDNPRVSAVEDFFVMLSDLASEKDIAANGPNPPLTRRSLHAVSLTMNEILVAMGRFQEAELAAHSTPQGAVTK